MEEAIDLPFISAWVIDMSVAQAGAPISLHFPVQASLELGGLTLHPDEHRLVGPRGELRLSGNAFAVMHRLMRRPGTIIPRSDLISAMYSDPDDEPEDADGCLRQVILTLRRAILLLGCGKSTLLLTEPSIGHLIKAVR
jgi:DNA-binding response OmpR family regulator